MKCRKLIICFGLLLSVFLSLSLSSDTFATDYTYNIINGTDSVFCKSSTSDPSDLPLCSDIKTITFSSDSVFTGSIRPTFSLDSSSSGNCSSSGSSAIYINFSVSKSVSLVDVFGICGFRFGSSFSLNGSTNNWTVILSTDLPGQSSSPTGNLDITENGEYDVTDYATATVNVENEVIYGDYHDDLVSINNSILICAAVCLVIYFFYCIYRMIIRNSGVK